MRAGRFVALALIALCLQAHMTRADDILAGRMQRVLPAHSIPTAPLHAIFPHSQNLAPRVRVFIDYLAARLQQAWRWDG